MARTQLVPQPIVVAGLEPAYAAANVDGHSITPAVNVFLHVKNGSASPINVTLDASAKVRGQAVPDIVVAVPASEDRMIGPFYTDLFSSPLTGLVNVDFSAVTTVTVALISI